MKEQDTNSTVCANCGGHIHYCGCRTLKVSKAGEVREQDTNSTVCATCGGHIHYCGCKTKRTK